MEAIREGTFSNSHAHRKQKRCFHRVMSGVNKQGTRDLRFLTLTSTESSPGDIGRSWQRVCQMLKRRGILKSYIKVTELTKRGLKHLHVLFRGTFLDQVLMSKLWLRVHGAEVVFIQKAYGGMKVAHYLSKYMSKGGERYSCDWGWVHLGFGKAWRWFKASMRWPVEAPFPEVLRAWVEHCRRIRELEAFWGVAPGRVFVACDPGSMHYYSGTVGLSATLQELVGWSAGGPRE